MTVAFDTTLTDELRLEARVYDLIHKVNGMRKEAGLEITDRIDLALPAPDADLLVHSEWIMAETLTLRLSVSDGEQLTLAKATR